MDYVHVYALKALIGIHLVLRYNFSECLLKRGKQLLMVELLDKSLHSIDPIHYVGIYVSLRINVLVVLIGLIVVPSQVVAVLLSPILLEITKPSLLEMTVFEEMLVNDLKVEGNEVDFGALELVVVLLWAILALVCSKYECIVFVVYRKEMFLLDVTGSNGFHEIDLWESHDE